MLNLQLSQDQKNFCDKKTPSIAVIKLRQQGDTQTNSLQFTAGELGEIWVVVAPKQLPTGERFKATGFSLLSDQTLFGGGEATLFIDNHKRVWVSNDRKWSWYRPSTVTNYGQYYFLTDCQLVEISDRKKFEIDEHGNVLV